jgi:hypothetical protein
MPHCGLQRYRTQKGVIVLALQVTFCQKRCKMGGNPIEPLSCVVV